jgi:drug/metabolite transporter (DMT)-like permease
MQAYRPWLGILFMCLASSFFPVMNGLAKLMSASYSSEQVVWARTLSHLVLVLAVVLPRFGPRVLITKRPKIQFLRSCMLLSSTFMFFSALQFISIAQAASISFIAPLIVVLLAGPLLGEKVTLTRVAAVLVGFLGVLIVIRPGTSVFQWASLLIVGSASCYAIY